MKCKPFQAILKSPTMLILPEKYFFHTVNFSYIMFFHIHNVIIKKLKLNIDVFGFSNQIRLFGLRPDFYKKF